MQAQVIETVAASAEAVFAHLGNFRGVTAGGPITSVDYEGDGVGMLRSIHTANGTVKERLDVHEPQALTYTYSIVNDDSPLPVLGYSATVLIKVLESDSCQVVWTGTCSPRDAEESKVVHILQGIYKNAIRGARIALTE